MSREECNENFKIREELKFLHERSKVHFRSIPVPLLRAVSNLWSSKSNRINRFTGISIGFFFNFWKLDKSDFEDFTSPEENYSKYEKLKNDLVQVQKRLSKMDIVEWHEITGSLHPANHVMDKVRVIWGQILENFDPFCVQLAIVWSKMTSDDPWKSWEQIILRFLYWHKPGWNFMKF